VRMRSLIKSTGFRFALLHTLVFVLSVSVIAWVAEVTVTSALERQARDRVETEATSLMAEYQRHGLAGLRSTIEERSSAAKRRLQYAIVDARGQAIVGDRYLAEFAQTSGSGAQIVPRHNGENATDNILVASRSLDGGLRLVIADNLESVEDVEDVVLNGFLVALALALLLGLGAGALFTRSLLRRVDGVTRTAEAIIGGDLTQRIALTGSGDDFDRLSTTLNTMLDTITDLLENLRQVSNDIAHDLRTPLARLRQQLEDARAHASAPADYERAIDRAIEEADALLDTFSALLRIAQIEAGVRRSSFRAVDLSDVMRTVADAYGPVLEDSGRSLETDIPVPFTMTGDRELLIQLFSNLIENALRHTPKGTNVAMRLSRAGSFACAELSDNGPGIPEGERSRVLRRFYRLEHSRTTPGNGLGLSLVAAIADVHGATVELSDNKPGLKITIRFPSN
jgi:signal transduction histidine kinase